MGKKKFKVEPLRGRASVDGGFAAGLAVCPLCKLRILIEVKNKGDKPESGIIMLHQKGANDCPYSNKPVSEILEEQGGK